MKIFFKGCSVHCSTYKNHLKIFVWAPTMPFFVPKYGHFWQKFAKRIIFLFFQEKGQISLKKDPTTEERKYTPHIVFP